MSCRIPFEIIVKILVEFEGHFVWRNSKLIHIGKLDKTRCERIRPVVPHPNFTTVYFPDQPMNLLPQLILVFGPTKKYIISIWYEDYDASSKTNAPPIKDVVFESMTVNGAPIIKFFGEF